MTAAATTRPEEGAPADLVDPGDEPGAAPGELFLEPEAGHGPEGQPWSSLSRAALPLRSRR